MQYVIGAVILIAATIIGFTLFVYRDARAVQKRDIPVNAHRLTLFFSFLIFCFTLLFGFGILWLGDLLFGKSYWLTPFSGKELTSFYVLIASLISSFIIYAIVRRSSIRKRIKESGVAMPMPRSPWAMILAIVFDLVTIALLSLLFFVTFFTLIVD